MKNADMPAMPIELNGFGQFAPEAHIGLTKREMIAKDMNVSLTGNFDNYVDMASFVGESWNPKSNIHSKILLQARVEAKLKVIAADALLAELEK